jgi:nucleoside-diphosphate-sugar epimerase
VADLVLGLGYLGAALTQSLLRDRRHVVGLDNGFSTDWPALERLAAGGEGRFRLLRGDLRDAADVGAAFEAARPVEAVYLLAAQASARRRAAPAEYTEETNLRGPRLVCEAALRSGRPPVVYGSSFHVYGPGPEGEVTEARPYGVLRDLAHLSKVYAEKLGELFAQTEGLPYAPVRLGIVYGPGPVTKRDLRFVTVPHAFCLRVLAGQPLPIHASGLAPLGFLHLEDAVAALRLATGLPDRERPYVPANAVGEVASVVQVARLVQRAAWESGHDAVLQLHAPEGQPEPAPFRVRSRLDGAGWRPRGRLAETVPRLFAYYAGEPSASHEA